MPATRVRIVEYLDRHGRSHFADWFEELGAQPAAKVSAALYRLAEGNFSNVESLGSGVFERKIDSGPGYRIYFGKHGDTIVVLLGGSAKRRQQDAIDAAKARWAEYRSRARET